jgi:two-component system cell cycle response regulator DivK
MPHDDSPRHTVLLVEDFEDTREMFATELRRRGYRVVEAADGREALDAAGRERPDLVLMDLSLPALDGLSAVYRMRESESLRRVPVIACSAHSADTHMEAARAVGCDEYVTKPVDLARLCETVGRLLSKGGGRDDAGAAVREHDARTRSDEELLEYLDGLMGPKV